MEDYENVIHLNTNKIPRYSIKIQNLMFELGKDISKEQIDKIISMFRLLKAEIEALIRFDITIKHPFSYFHVNNIVVTLISLTQLIDQLVCYSYSFNYMLNMPQQLIDPRIFDSNIKNCFQQITVFKAETLNQLIRLNRELELINQSNFIFRNVKDIKSSIKSVNMNTTSFNNFDKTKTLVLNNKPKLINNEFSNVNIENSINFDIKELNTNLVAENIKKFICEHRIRESYFSQKILRASFLTFKNIVDFPQEWFSLNDLFKLYFKRASLFLNNFDDQNKFFKSYYNTKFENEEEENNMLLYDISTLEITDDNHVSKIIDDVIERLNVTRLNRKILCDAVLGIPSNTFSSFSSKLKKLHEYSDYAKEAIMRMMAWYNDPNGVKQLLEWKETFYTSKTKIEIKCKQNTQVSIERAS